jgi:hypothetical protein
MIEAIPGYQRASTLALFLAAFENSRPRTRTLKVHSTDAGYLYSR